MNPTTTQLKTIDTIISILDIWKNTDDIESPIHINEIEEILDDNLGECVSLKHIGCLVNEINTLLYRVRKIK